MASVVVVLLDHRHRKKRPFQKGAEVGRKEIKQGPPGTRLGLFALKVEKKEHINVGARKPFHKIKDIRHAPVMPLNRILKKG